MSRSQSFIQVRSSVPTSGWFWSENAIFKTKVSAYAKLTYLYLKRCADSEGESFPSHRAVAEAVGCGITRVKASLGELVEANLLHLEAQQGRVNLYTVLAVKQETQPPGDRDPAATRLGGSRHAATEGLPIEGPPKKDHHPLPPQGGLSVEGLVELYNERAPDNVPAVETISPKRRERATKWLKVYPERQWWVEVFDAYHRSRFLSGRSKPTPGHESFRPDFDWLLANGKSGVENAVKVHDGAYDD